MDVRMPTRPIHDFLEIKGVVGYSG